MALGGPVETTGFSICRHSQTTSTGAPILHIGQPGWKDAPSSPSWISIKGFHQIPVRLQDMPNTAVITPFGLWEFVCMPFGLRSAGQSFQCFMDKVLEGLDYCFVYVDDVLIRSRTPEEHV